MCCRYICLDESINEHSSFFRWISSEFSFILWTVYFLHCGRRLTPRSNFFLQKLCKPGCLVLLTTSSNCKKLSPMFVKSPKRQNNFSRAISMLRNSTQGLDCYIFQAKLVLCLAIVLLEPTWLPPTLFDSTSRSYQLSTKHSIIELTSDRYSSLYRDIETSRTTIVFFRFSGKDPTMTGKSWVSCDCVLEEIIAVPVLMARRAEIPQYRESSTKQFRDSGMDSIEIYCDRWNAEVRCVLSEGNSGYDRKLRGTKLLSRPHTVAMFFLFILGLAGWQAFLLRGDAYTFCWESRCFDGRTEGNVDLGFLW